MQLSDYFKLTGLRDGEFARKIGCHRVSVLRYRRRVKIPSSEIIKKIVKATAGAVTADDLLQMVPNDSKVETLQRGGRR